VFIETHCIASDANFSAEDSGDTEQSEKTLLQYERDDQMSSESHRLRGKSQLDNTDRRILSALIADGRLTNAELASRVGLSPSPCWTRVRRLEACGAIERYTALINQKMLGLHDIVFVEITLQNHDEQVLERFGAALSRMPEVLEAHLVTGDYDYLVKVAVADTALPGRGDSPITLDLFAESVEEERIGGPAQSVMLQPRGSS
jgi:Lrp/AsnC family leucine-responsive transcriptional regulator